MESVLRGAAVYAFLLVVMRLSGRRTLAQMTPFDFVLVLIIAETTRALTLKEASLGSSLNSPARSSPLPSFTASRSSRRFSRRMRSSIARSPSDPPLRSRS